MRYNNSVNTRTTSCSNMQIDEKLKKINEQITALTNSINGLSLVVYNDKVNVSTFDETIANINGDISDINQEFIDLSNVLDTNTINAHNINADTVLSNEYLFYNIDENSHEVSEIFEPTPGGIYFAKSNSGKAIIKYISQTSFVVLSNIDDFVSYKNQDNNTYFKFSEPYKLFALGESFSISETPIVDATYIKAGTTISGPLYADLLANYEFDNLNVSNTVTAGNIEVNEASIVNANVQNLDAIDIESNNISANSGDIEELVSEQVSADRVNSAQIHTKVEKENIGYTIIPAHQANELYAIAVPITNGIWEIELEGSIKATIAKTNSAVEVTYWRNTQNSLLYIGVKEDILYLYTYDSGKVYFSNTTLEIDDTTISTYAPTSPNYPILDTLDYKFEIITKQGIVNTTTTYINDLIVTGRATIEENNADDIYVEANDSDSTMYPTFVDSNNTQRDIEKLYTSSNITFNPNKGIIGASILDLSERIKVSNKFYVGDSITQAQLEQLEDNALVITCGD